MFERFKLLVLVMSIVVVLYVLVGSFLGKVVAKDETYKNISIFNDVLKKIQDEYVESPDFPRLTDSVLVGLAEGIDFYSTYLNAEQYKQILARQDALASSGLVLSPQVGYYRVLQVLPGSPAESAGVFPGDVIEEIDGAGVAKASYPQVSAMLRGAPETSVRLGILRGRDEELQEINVRLKELASTPPQTRLLEPGIGYLKLIDIQEHAADEVVKATRFLLSNDTRKLVLDLRDCCSGSYTEAIRIADLFVDQGVLATRKGKAAGEVKFTATSEDTIFRDPLVVLVNGYTSGPAEVIALALHQTKRGRIVGQKTYGTASEQKFVELGDGSALFLTHARYCDNSGTPIMNKKLTLAGVKPDVKAPPEDFALSQYIDYELASAKESYSYYKKYLESVYQKQLEKALEVLREDQPALAPAA